MPRLPTPEVKYGKFILHVCGTLINTKTRSVNGTFIHVFRHDTKNHKHESASTTSTGLPVHGLCTEKVMNQKIGVY